VRMILGFFRAIATLFVFLILVLLMVALFLPNPMEQYKETADLTKLTSHFEEAVRLSRSTLAKSYRQDALGITNTTPTTAADWVLLLNPSMVIAPGGGPAYLPDDSDGDAATGAIGIIFISEERRVIIAKPAFRSLQAETITVTAEFLLEE